mmetsp:Transcript_31669/g.100984  ORF Transcript_31669/g.100984 Transcript_31669/m.100984 type:complete len:222 (-) Transcript_31669:337-1002(-)
MDAPSTACARSYPSRRDQSSSPPKDSAVARKPHLRGCSRVPIETRSSLFQRLSGGGPKQRAHTPAGQRGEALSRRRCDASRFRLKQWSPVMTCSAHSVSPPCSSPYEPQYFANAFSSSNTHSSPSAGWAKSGCPFRLSQGKKSSTQTRIHAWPTTSQSRSAYLPRGETCVCSNRFCSTPGNSARQAAAASSQQSPSAPCAISAGWMPSLTSAVPRRCIGCS